jgi:hypothetical protein
MIPDEILTAICGSLMTITVATFAAINKSIPFKITFGGEKKMKDECITKEDLRINCDIRQSPIEKKLELIFIGIQEANNKIDNLHEMVVKHRIELGERLARVEEYNGKS